eukprot:gene2842-15018_t
MAAEIADLRSKIAAAEAEEQRAEDAQQQLAGPESATARLVGMRARLRELEASSSPPRRQQRVEPPPAAASAPPDAAGAEAAAAAAVPAPAHNPEA